MNLLNRLLFLVKLFDYLVLRLIDVADQQLLLLHVQLSRWLWHCAHLDEGWLLPPPWIVVHAKVEVLLHYSMLIPAIWREGLPEAERHS